MAETSIDRLTLDIVVNNDNATRRINNITKAIEKLNTAMGKSGNIEKVLDKINDVSPTSTGGGRTSKGGTNKTSKNLNIFATLGKWNYMINMTRYYGRSLANVVQLAMDYVETQNLWQVANRNNLEMAEQFIQKMNKAYGISEQTLMNYQAIFKNMLSALGDLSDEISSGLSMQLTQMALDFSSLYNVTIPSAMQKFQAVLSGQVRPIRSVSGYDITENTIYDLYAGAGGEKTMRQLSQIEKRLLRIVAVFDQMGATGATGDMAKTIESASNQARIMSEQAKETLTWTGQLVLMWMDSAGILQHINAFLITMKEIMRTIAYDMGYSEKNFLDGLVTSAEDAGEAIDDIQGKLLSFDKFEALNSNKGNVLGIDKTVLDLLQKVNYATEDFKMESQQIADRWLISLDLVDANGDGILDMSQKLKNLLGTLKSIALVIAGIAAFNLISKIPTFISLIVALIAKMQTYNLQCALASTKSQILQQTWKSMAAAGVAVGVAVTSIISNWDTMSRKQKGWVIAIATITAAIAALAFAVYAASQRWAKAISVASGVITTGMTVAAAIPMFKEGGFPEDGLFFANSGEMVGKFTNGRTAVANNDQIVTGITQGVYNAMMAYNAQTRGQGGSGDVYLDGTKVGRVVAKSSHNEMVRVGLVKANR